MKKYVAEMIGTMVLVLMGCGSAVFAGSVAGTVGAGCRNNWRRFGVRPFSCGDGLCYRRYFWLSY